MSPVYVVALLAAVVAAIASKKMVTQKKEEGPLGDIGYGMPKESSNASSRKNKMPTTLVIHYTAGESAKSTVDWFMNPQSKVSAHFVVDRDGSVIQCVSLDMAAWAVGNSSVTNNASISIEIVCAGKRDAGKEKPGDKYATLSWPSGKTVSGVWQPFTDAQYEAVRNIIARLKSSKWAAVTSDIRGHEDIATPEGRKVDPGPLFDWSKVCDESQRKYKKTTSTVTGRVA